MAFLAVSCSKQRLANMNKDVKHPATGVPGNALFASAQKALADQDAEINVNLNNFDLWSQYLTETTYTNEANYDIYNRGVPGAAWLVYYRDVLMNLKVADSLIKNETISPMTDAFKIEKANRRAILDIVACYTWDKMETLWGNIPYSQALNIDNSLPAYDDAYTIHQDLISRVTADVKALNPDPQYGSFGNEDLYYGGNVSDWVAFGNGLLIKMAIQIADYTPAKALVTTTIQNAMAGAISSPSQNAIIHYISSIPNENPLNNNLVLSGRSDYVAANTIIDAMTNFNDPRMAYYWDNNLGTADTAIYTGATVGASSSFPNYTHVNSNIANDGAYPHPMMTYSEIQFYLAEAAARGIITGDAATYYDNAITASIKYWCGSGVSNAQIATYLAQPGVKYDATNWASDSTEAKKLIGTQAWISFYTRWYLSWTEWRRLGFPTFSEPANLNSYGSGVNTFPFRYPYPISEQTLNADNWNAAVTAQGWSVDDMNQKLYWEN